MKKDGDKNLKGVSLGIEALHKHFLGSDVEVPEHKITVGHQTKTDQK